MRVCVFTCRRDREKAELATRTIPADWEVVWVLDEPDADLPVPDGVMKEVAPFKRGTNLAGPNALMGISKVLNHHAQPWGRVGKVDSDCLLIEPGFLLKGELAGMTQGFPGAVYGLAYALSAKAIGRAMETIWRDRGLGAYPKGEDAAISLTSKAGGGILKPGAFWDSPHRGTLPPAGVVAIHCGHTGAAPREGPQVAREMRRLGDALGLWRRG